MVTFLAQDKGKLTGIARGAKIPTGRGVGVYEPFTRGTIYYVQKSGSDLVQIRKCDPVPPYLMLSQNYDSIIYAGYITELIEISVIGADEAAAFYELLCEHLVALADPQATPQHALTRLSFELGYLRLLGLHPDWSRCCACGKALFTHLPGKRGSPAHGRDPGNCGGRLPAISGEHTFDIRRGGVRCPQCRVESGSSPVLSAGSLAFLAAWRGGETGASIKPTRLALEQLETAVSRHLVHRLEREPRSMSLLPTLPASASHGEEPRS